MRRAVKGRMSLPPRIHSSPLRAPYAAFHGGFASDTATSAARAPRKTANASVYTVSGQD